MLWAWITNGRYVVRRSRISLSIPAPENVSGLVLVSHSFNRSSHSIDLEFAITPCPETDKFLLQRGCGASAEQDAPCPLLTSPQRPSESGKRGVS